MQDALQAKFKNEQDIADKAGTLHDVPSFVPSAINALSMGYDLRASDRRKCETWLAEKSQAQLVADQKNEIAELKKAAKKKK